MISGCDWLNITWTPSLRISWKRNRRVIRLSCCCWLISQIISRNRRWIWGVWSGISCINICVLDRNFVCYRWINRTTWSWANWRIVIGTWWWPVLCWAWYYWNFFSNMWINKITILCWGSWKNGLDWNNWSLRLYRCNWCNWSYGFNRLLWTTWCNGSDWLNRLLWTTRCNWLLRNNWTNRLLRLSWSDYYGLISSRSWWYSKVKLSTTKDS